MSKIFITNDPEGIIPMGTQIDFWDFYDRLREKRIPANTTVMINNNHYRINEETSEDNRIVGPYELVKIDPP